MCAVTIHTTQVVDVHGFVVVVVFSFWDSVEYIPYLCLNTGCLC